MKVKALAVNGAALGLVMVNVPTDVPLTTMLAGAAAKLMLGGSSVDTVSVTELAAALLPTDELSPPTGKLNT